MKTTHEQYGQLRTIGKIVRNPWLAIALALALTALRSQASLIDVNFANNQATGYPLPISGAAALGSPGDQWNTITKSDGASVGGTNYNLINTSGAGSGLKLQVNAGAFDGADKSSSGNQTLYDGDIFLDASSTYGPPGPSTITLTGLTPGQAINLLAYASGSEFTFAGVTKQVVGGDQTTFNSANYAEFDGLVADSSGTITGTWNPGTGQTFAYLNGIQINTSATAASLSFATQPASHSGYAGASTTFNVLGTGGSGFYKYQWYQNSSPLLNQTNSTLLLTSLSTNMDGYVYYATANDGSSTVTSSNATLSVISGVQFIDVNFANNQVTGYPLPISGPAAVGSPGDQWNTLSGNDGSSVPPAELHDTTGVDSGVRCNLSSGVFDGTDKTGQSIETLYKGDIFMDASSTYGPPGPSAITLSGFAPGQPVTLYFYAATSSSFVYSNQTLTPSGGDLSTFNPGNYVTFSNLLADASGSISATWEVASGSTYAYFYGFQAVVNTGIKLPVYIHTQPVSVSAYSGNNATFTVQAAAGDGNYLYQWYQNASPLTGQTNASLSLNDVNIAMNGNNYYVKVQDGTNQVTSTVAVLTVANAELVDVNFEFGNSSFGPSYPLPISGPAILGAAGDIWNTITSSNYDSVSCLCLLAPGQSGANPATAFPLASTSGKESGISLSVSVGTFNGADNSGATWPTLFKGNIFLYLSSTYGPSGPSVITISGVGSRQSINLLLYANESSYFTFPTNNSQLIYPSDASPTAFDAGSYVEYDGLIADTNGVVTGIWNNLGTYAFFYGLQIVKELPPTLNADIESGQIVIRWPAAASGFNLYTSPTVGAGAAWSQVNNPLPVTDPSNTNLLKVSVSQQSKAFYRLQK